LGTTKFGIPENPNRKTLDAGLVLRALEECREFYPDVGFDRFSGRLFAALFSHRNGFLYQNY
jgi:hypothetical protein